MSDAILVPTWLHFPRQNPPKSKKKKIDPKMHQILDRFFDRFFIDVGSILEANLEPCWPPFPPKSRAKRASTPAQSDQDRQEPQKLGK